MPFQKGHHYGNRQGRPRQPEVEILREAIEKVKKESGIHPIEKFVKDAMVDKGSMNALMKKILPDLKQSEILGTGEHGELVFEVRIVKGHPQVARTSPESEGDPGLPGKV